MNSFPSRHSTSLRGGYVHSARRSSGVVLERPSLCVRYGDRSGYINFGSHCLLGHFALEGIRLSAAPYPRCLPVGLLKPSPSMYVAGPIIGRTRLTRTSRAVCTYEPSIDPFAHLLGRTRSHATAESGCCPSGGTSKGRKILLTRIESI